MTNKDELFEDLREKFLKLAMDNNLLEEDIIIRGRPLTAKEAIGNPDRQDFPLIKGKEKLMQAEFRRSFGQAFTDMPSNFEGSLKDVLYRPITSNFDRAVFIASLNAVLRYLGKIDFTVHCKDNEPEDCAEQFIEYIANEYGNPKIALIGFQPSFLEKLASNYEMRVLDLDKDRIGTMEFGVRVEDGEKTLEDILDWCDLVIATGSTVVNGTIVNFLNRDKPVVFYGTTVAGAAELLGLQRYCVCAK